MCLTPKAANAKTMSWFFFALGAGVVSAVNVALSKRLVSELGPLWLGAMVHLMGALLCLIALPFSLLKLTFTPLVTSGLLVMGIVYTLGNALYFSALKSTDLSEIDLLLRSSSLWTFLLGVLLLAEPYSPRILLASGFIISSILLLSRQRFSIHFNRAQLLALGAAFCFGLGNVIDKALSPNFDALSYTSINLFLTGIGMLGLTKSADRSLPHQLILSLPAWGIALTFALTQWLIILAFTAGGEAGQVILVAQLRLVILMAVGIIVLKERERITLKLLAAFIMIVGLMLLYG